MSTCHNNHPLISFSGEVGDKPQNCPLCWQIRKRKQAEQRAEHWMRCFETLRGRILGEPAKPAEQLTDDAELRSAYDRLNKLIEERQKATEDTEVVKWLEGNDENAKAAIALLRPLLAAQRAAEGESKR